MSNYHLTSIFSKFKYLATTLFAIFLASGISIAAEKNLTILVTGANRGLGLEHAKQWKEAGYNVIGTARNPDKAKELKATGVTVMNLDITSDEDIANLAKKLKGQKIDILLNNAAYMDRNLDREGLKRCFDVNAAGPMLLAEALKPNLKMSDQPKIINVSSRLGIINNSRGIYPAYSISKAALNMVTAQLHAQLKSEGFIVISLGPGHNQTDMGGKGAPLKPKDSVKQMMKLVSKLNKMQSGKFWYHNGTEMPW